MADNADNTDNTLNAEPRAVVGSRPAFPSNRRRKSWWCRS